MKLGIHKPLAAALGLALLTALSGAANADTGTPALLQSMESQTIELSDEQKLSTRGEYFSSALSRDLFCKRIGTKRCVAKGSTTVFGKKQYYAKIGFSSLGKATFHSY